MSIRTMTRRCVHCHRSYTYNISTGDLGSFCKLCGKPQFFSSQNLPFPTHPETLPIKSPKHF